MNTSEGQNKRNDTTPDAAEGREDALASRARADRLGRDVPRRLMREGRWAEVAGVRDRMMRECLAKHMPKADARAFVYAELDRLYPPLPDPEPSPEQPVEPVTGQLRGLGDIPDDWGELPANASLQAEVGWVQSNRLIMVEDTASGATHVHLDRAHEPAPSRAALGWLETSIRSYAKYVDVVARSLHAAEDEQDHVRRERVALEEIDELLAQMEE